MSKSILVTGASAGFGKDAAETLAKAGHQVFATVRDRNGRSRAVAEELRAKRIEVLELDVTNDASVDAAFKALTAKRAASWMSSSTMRDCLLQASLKRIRPSRFAKCLKSTCSEFNA